MKTAPHYRLLLGAALLSTTLSACGGSNKTTIPLSEDVVYSYSMIVDSNGTVWGSGYNEYGELGIGNLDNQSAFQQVTSPTGVTAVAQGTNHTLALTSDGTVWATGCNFAGRLGVGSSINSNISAYSYSKNFVKVTLPAAARSIGAGWQHSVAALSDGSVYSWGANSDGQLGINKDSSSASYKDSPVQVVGPDGTGTLANIGKVAAGGNHSLALASDNTTLYAWGRNEFGQAGQATGSTVLRPTQITGLPTASLTISDIAARHSFSMVRMSDGEVWGWGYNAYGQLGNGHIGSGSTTTNVSAAPTPVRVADGDTADIFSGASKISLGTMHVLALKVNPVTHKGEVWSWGFNEQGQLGIQDENLPAGTGKKTLPVSHATRASVLDTLIANSSSGVTEIYAFGTQSFARIDGLWYGWGDNGWGQLGQPVPKNDVGYILRPVQITAIPVTIPTPGPPPTPVAARVRL